MTDKELIQALRKVHDAYFTPGVHSHSIYGVAADRLEALLAENERLWDSARRLWAGMPRYCGDLPRFAMHADDPPSTEGVERMSYRNECKYGDSCGFDFCVPEYCKDFEPTQMTNADRIHSMDDSNLAIFLTQTAIQGCPYPKMDCEANCKECIQKWLQQPCEEGTVCST